MVTACVGRYSSHTWRDLRECPQSCGWAAIGRHIDRNLWLGSSAARPRPCRPDLRLYGKVIRDQHLDCLANLKSLRQLSLDGTSVTERAVQKLQNALPECEIKFLIERQLEKVRFGPRLVRERLARIEFAGKMPTIQNSNFAGGDPAC